LIGVILRTAPVVQVIALFHAVREPGNERLPPAVLQAADPNVTEPPSFTPEKRHVHPFRGGRYPDSARLDRKSIGQAYIPSSQSGITKRYQTLPNLTKNMLKPHERVTSILYYLSRKVGNAVVLPPEV
jgi:hypothetical protein